MTWLQFIASIVSALAWPTIIGLIFITYKSDISKLFLQIGHFKFKDLEIYFNALREQKQTLLHTKSSVIDTQDQCPFFLSMEEQIFDAVNKDPIAAIILAWSSLESAMAESVSRLPKSPEYPSHRSSSLYPERLLLAEKISFTHYNLIRELQNIRNQVVHQRSFINPVSHKQAKEYADTAIQMIRYFKELSR